MSIAQLSKTIANGCSLNLLWLRSVIHCKYCK